MYPIQMNAGRLRTGALESSERRAGSDSGPTAAETIEAAFDIALAAAAHFVCFPIYIGTGYGRIKEGDSALENANWWTSTCRLAAWKLSNVATHLA